MKELIAYAKANPAYGSQGNGSTSHLTGQMFATMTGTDMVHVPFKGEGPALNELHGGRVDLFTGNVSAVMKFQQNKQVKMLGKASTKRSTIAPDVSTVAEAGSQGFVASAWFALAAPSGTPAPITSKLNAAVTHILKMPDVVQKYATEGVELPGGTPAEMTSFMNAERASWKKVIDTAKVTLDCHLPATCGIAGLLRGGMQLEPENYRRTVSVMESGLWCKISARPNDFLGVLRRSGRKDRVPDRRHGLARNAQPVQVELGFADAMQQLDAGDRHGRAIEDLEAEHRLDT